MNKEKLNEICKNKGFFVVFGDKHTIVRLEYMAFRAVVISEEKICSMEIDFPKIDHSKEHSDVLYACIDYASTPIEERGSVEEKRSEAKYKLYHRYMNNSDNSQIFKVNLILDKYDSLAVESVSPTTQSHQVIQNVFTKRQIDILKKEYNTTFDDFYIREVDEHESLD